MKSKIIEEMSRNTLNLAEGRAFTVWVAGVPHDLEMIEVRDDVLIAHPMESVRRTAFIPVHKIDMVEISEGVDGEPLYVLRPRGARPYRAPKEEVDAYPEKQKRIDEIEARRRRGEPISAEDDEFAAEWFA